MGSRKLDLKSAPLDYDRTVEQFYATAFGPSPSLYRQVSLCGWRPLVDHRKRACDSTRPVYRNTPSDRSLGIEVYETADGMTIEVALSTIKEDSLHLAVSSEAVIIRGERIKTEAAKNKIPVAQRRKPQFQYFIPLPSTISTGGFRAQLEGDIVRIDFAKRSS